jgi:hypothetical protein
MLNEIHLCICQHCYYGEKCQFSISTFIFSLHSILEYHIKAKISLRRQSLIIQISILLFVEVSLSLSLSL